MKSISIHILILLISIPTFGQQLEGCYKNKSDSLSFSNNNVIFNISDFGALTTQIVGEGTYEFEDNFLIVKTGKYSGNKSQYKELESTSKDSINISVKDINSYPKSGVLVEFLSKSNKLIDNAITNETGKVKKPINNKIEKISISHMGYDNINIDCDGTKDYSIILIENTVIEDKTIVMEVITEDSETISVKLISHSFNPGKNMDKSLAKIQKEAKKSNILSKRFKKEYVSMFYNK